MKKQKIALENYELVQVCIGQEKRFQQLPTVYV